MVSYLVRRVWYVKWLLCVRSSVVRFRTFYFWAKISFEQEGFDGHCSHKNGGLIQWFILGEEGCVGLFRPLPSSRSDTRLHCLRNCTKLHDVGASLGTTRWTAVQSLCALLQIQVLCAVYPLAYSLYFHFNRKLIFLVSNDENFSFYVLLNCRFVFLHRHFSKWLSPPRRCAIWLHFSFIMNACFPCLCIWVMNRSSLSSADRILRLLRHKSFLLISSVQISFRCQKYLLFN
jgi:hypothetical protein